MKVEPFNLAEAIKDVCALLTPRFSARRLTLEMNLDAETLEVRADRDKVKQILTNLVDNAVKYNKEGGTVTVSMSSTGGRLRVMVRDTGLGIAPEYMESLFERFHRLPATSAEAAKVKGAGLGLAISRGLARAMDGELEAESVVGAGSSFSLIIPTRKA